MTELNWQLDSKLGCHVVIQFNSVRFEKQTNASLRRNPDVPNIGLSLYLSLSLSATNRHSPGQ